MGRHSAGSRAPVDPIVAAALSQRAALVAPPRPRPAPDLAESPQDGGLGWPGEPGEGSGLGWPDDATPDGARPDGATPDGATPSGTTPDGTGADDATAADTAVAALAVAPAARRRSSWRRWFGGSPAVPPTPSGSTAA